jgi:type I restriction enzyme R subunit
MSTLLDEIIAARKQKAIEYEEYLKKIADLVKQVETGQGGKTSAQLDTPGKRALFNNLNRQTDINQVNLDRPVYESGVDPWVALAIRLDEKVREVRPDQWRGHLPSENIIKQTLFNILKNEDEVERLFQIIKQQPEY